MMNNLYPLLTGNYKEGVTDLDRLITPALMRIVRKKYRGYQKKFRYPDLTAGQKAEVRKYFGKYERVNLLCHRLSQRPRIVAIIDCHNRAGWAMIVDPFRICNRHPDTTKGSGCS